MIEVSTASDAIHRWAREWCEDPLKAHDVAFHMTDWLGELKALAELLEDPTSRTADQAQGVVIDFLLHAVQHLAAASKVLLDTPVEDVFEIGAVGDGSAEPRLNLIVIRARNPAEARTLYEALGLRFQREQHGNGPDHFAAVLGQQVFEIYPATDEQPVSSLRLGFRVRSVSAAIEAATAAGATVVREPRDSADGEQRAVLQDPDGRKIELSGRR